uniref:Nucleolar protein 16 n=1 Tax=Crassostrea virginica TaxID=6565 RepID=A0A8B8ENE5_CRAVI|nr:nucleolar protein 16-like [Crassostrea virginica]
MARLRKQRKAKKYNYDKNRRKAWKKSKKLPTIECAQIKQAWDPKKSVRKNLEEMGISADPNQTFKIPKTKDMIEIEGSDKSQESKKKKTSKHQPKEHVVQELEMEANLPLEKTLRLSSEEAKYCIYMMEKYGEDYKAMARDRRNYYQDTPKQIKKKINTFKNIPEQYNEYLSSKSSKASESRERFIPSHTGEQSLSGHAVRPTDNQTVAQNTSLTEVPSQDITFVGRGCLTPQRQLMKKFPGRIPFRVTRTYTAKRRNGHYLTPILGGTPVKNPDVTAIYFRNEVPIHKVKRKLQFGRKPPRERN